MDDPPHLKLQSVEEVLGRDKAVLYKDRANLLKPGALLVKGERTFKLAPWDWWYYAEKLKKAKYDLDDQALKRLMGIAFQKTPVHESSRVPFIGVTDHVFGISRGLMDLKRDGRRSD
jgi:hypothetical protein